MVGTDPNGQGGVATVVRGYILSNFFKKQGIRYISSHNSDYGSFKNIALFLSSLMKIFFDCIFNRFELIHIHVASRGSFFRKSLILLTCKLFGKKAILHLHGAEFKLFYLRESNKLKQWYIRMVFHKANKVIVLGKSWQSWITSTLNVSASRVHVVYNSVDSQVQPMTNFESKDIIFLGRVGQRKGVEDLLNAFKKVKLEVPEASLKIGGDGELDTYKKYVEKNLITGVTFLGWVGPIEKVKLLQQATIYTLPSYNEGFPMGVIEAMSFGVPVVASDVGGIPDAIPDETKGFTIKPGDVSALSEKLICLLKDACLHSNISQSSFSFFNSNFSRDITEKEIVSIYEELKG